MSSLVPVRRKPPFVLDGAHVIVTGGSSGIGLATARHLAAAGSTVSLIARDLTKLDAAAEDAHYRVQ